MLEAGVLDDLRGREIGEGLCDPNLGWGQRGKGDRPWQVSCYKVGDETGGLDLRRVGGMCILLQPTSCSGLAGVPGGVGDKDQTTSGWTEIRKGISVDSTGDGSRGRESCHGWCSVAALVMRLGD